MQTRDSPAGMSAGRAWATEAMVQARVASLGSATLTPVAAPVPVLATVMV